ncbi:uncharacterized protein [Linepithema humile]|uniref:uncharacterized protein isoform X2 n=1 Tax=Linepithema humile TaxID=83485 RepID=UPI00351F5CFC
MQFIPDISFYQDFLFICDISRRIFYSILKTNITENITAMDDKCIPSAEEMLVATNDSPRYSESPNSKILKCYSEKCSNVQNEESVQNLIDHENISMICIQTSDEDDASRRLENQFQLVTDLDSSIDREKEAILHERARKLCSEMTGLREKLNKELALWKKEKEEFQLLRERNDVLAFEEATAAARAAAAAYAIESPLSNDLSSIVDITSEHNITDLAILEYEKNLAKYQDPHSLEQAEQRYNLYKRALADAYKQKLSEVERLCNEEMENIRRSANCLQPFKEIASQWSSDENDHGDMQRGCNEQFNVEQFKVVETNFSNDWCAYGKIDNEVNMAPEILSSRFKREETKT